MKVRWAACGYGKDEEKFALENCTRILLERMEKNEALAVEDGEGKTENDA